MVNRTRTRTRVRHRTTGLGDCKPGSQSNRPYTVHHGWKLRAKRPPCMQRNRVVQGAPVMVASLTRKRQASRVLAAANGSNRIVLRCPGSPGIDTLTCLDDLYRPSCHSFTPRRSKGTASCPASTPKACTVNLALNRHQQELDYRARPQS